MALFTLGTRRSAPLQSWQVAAAALLRSFVTIIGAELFVKLRPGRKA